MLVLGSLFYCSLSAQHEVVSEQITTADGLSQGAIYDIIQDSEGFMWFGTKDGLNRYDGYNFKVFTNDPDDPYSISGNQVRKLYEDSKGYIWASVDDHGLSIYDKSTGRFHNISHNPSDPSGLSGSHVIQIIEDTSGYFILNIEENEINILKLQDDFLSNSESIQVIRIQMPGEAKRSDEFVSSLLKGIAKDPQNRIWVGAHDAIYRLDIQQAQLNFVMDGYSIGESCENDDRAIWVGGFHNPLSHWDGQTIKTVDSQFVAIKSLCKDKDDQIWMVRADSIVGISIFQDQNSESIQYERVLSWTPAEIESTDYPFGCLAFDQSGLMWVGTNGFGLYKINPAQWNFNYTLDGISIRQIVPINHEEYFVNTYSGWFTQDGVSKSLHPLGPEISLDDMLYSSDGHYWIRESNIGSNQFALKHFDSTQKISKSAEIPWYHYDNQPMIETRDGSVWMAGFNHILTCVEPERLDVFSYELERGQRIEINNNTEKLLSLKYSTALYEDGQGTIWVGTETGMIKCKLPVRKEQKIDVQHYKNIPGDQHSLSYNHVMSFLDDPREPNQYLWVGTKGGGLNRLDKKSGQFIRITQENGLPNDVIYGILNDENGRIWGSTNKGIFCLIDLDIQNDLFQFRNFSKQDGLQEDEFNTGAYMKMPDGRLAFGGVNGLNIFDPEKVLTDSYEPAVQFTQVLIGNTPLTPGDETGVLENVIEKTTNITLQPHHDILTVEFASLDFTNPEKNKYRYQLIGAYDSWVELGNQRSATFMHLKPKEYTFRVQGSNSQGLWSSRIAELNICVLPPWWKTVWAYLSYALILGIAAYFGLKIYFNRIKLKQQLEFEKREADRIRELDEQKSLLFTNMTHEFRTPLTIILGMAKQMKKESNDQSESKYDMIIRNGQNLLGLVSKMLDLSKIESGKLELNWVRDDIIGFLRSLTTSFSSLVEQKDIQLHFLPEINKLTTSYDPDKLQQIVSNLITNAYKFTPDGGNIYLTAKTENQTFILKVRDTGQGISSEHIEHVFDRFYQADPSSTREHEGTGIGLALTKELVTLMGGQIHAVSPPVGANVGTEFIVALPLKQTNGVNKMKPVTSMRNVPTSAHMPQQVTSSEPHKVQPIAHDTELKESSNPVILLVEDNADVVAYIAACLKELEGLDSSMKGYQLVVGENGREGLDMAIELIPDLVISDVMMPVMDGFEFCRHLKTDGRTSHIPVIILTAKADLDSKIEGLEHGANAYLAKPFEPQELLLTIQNLFSLRNNLRKRFQEQLGSNTYTEVEQEIEDSRDALLFEDPFVQKVVAIIESRLSDIKLEVGQIAKEVYLSHSQLARKLDAITGYSPNRFIRLIRLNQAKKLLRDESKSITAIAYECGFSDPSYFSRVFKKEFGKTPVEWKEQLKVRRMN